MAFYSIEDPGMPIDHLEAEEKIALNFLPIGDKEAGTPELKLYWGFVPKALLESLLEEPGCVGVRIYSAFIKDIQTKLIVVAVREDGDEIRQSRDGDSGYSVNQIKFNDIQETTILDLANDHIQREAVAKRVMSSYLETSGSKNGLKIAFASYFSAKAIRTLLQPETCNGICCYVVGLGQPANPPFSHLAVSVRYSETAKQIDRMGEAGQHIICPNPCPDHCAKDTSTSEVPVSFETTKETASLAFASTPVSAAQISTSAFDKYLMRWD